LRKPKQKQIGRGFAIAQWLPLGGEAHSVVAVAGDGRVTVATGMVDQGAGTYTAMRQIAAHELGVAIASVTFESLDTAKIGSDTGVGASRATRIFGNATQLAATQARHALLNLAGGILGAPADELLLTGDGAVRTIAGKAIRYADLAQAAGGSICGRGYYKDFTAGPPAALCAQIAEVEVDVETGAVHLRKIITAHSTGRVINPLLHQGQIDGGVVMAVGYSLMEQVTIDQGRVVTTSFGENKIPSIKDIPKLKTVIQEIPVGNGPYGAMSIGEPPVIPTAAAVANAVHDAVGVRIFDLPITAEKVLRGLAATW
jgi:CO/xanthine dehydrogenase Mo-binding subunit